MKWLIASDIHGSLYYGKKLIEQIKKEEPDKEVHQYVNIYEYTENQDISSFSKL